MKDFLQPRYKVILDFPGISDYGWKLNQILDEHVHKNLVSNLELLDKYPHLFKKLAWWEEREENAMPEYVKGMCLSASNVYAEPKEVIFKYSKAAFIFASLENFLPATKEEFDAQKNKL